jgi:hypothetical protein
MVKGAGKRKSAGVLMTSRQAAQARKLSIAQVEKMISTRAVSPGQVAVMPDPLLHRMVRRIKFADLPAAREQFRLLHLRSDSGIITPNRRVMAVQQQNRLRSVRTKAGETARVAGVPVGAMAMPSALAEPTGGVQLGSWSALGPTNIGGRTRSIIIDSNTPSTMLVGSVGGGIWRSDDGGASWLPVDDLMANLAVCCLAMDPTDSRIVYAGTGEGFFQQ